MALNPQDPIDFTVVGIDGGERRVRLPPPLPAVADDFDWIARDYDSFRLMMMEELAYRHPERRRWTPADVEAVIVELVAAGLDRLSHATDAIHAERYLETARRPQSVRRLLQMIGYDPLASSEPYPGEPRLGDEKERAAKTVELERFWREHPAAMEHHRALGPVRIREQMRMVTLADYVRIIEEHPLVERARARLVGSGAWTTILVTVQLLDDGKLDEPIDLADETKADLVAQLARYNGKYRLPEFRSGATTPRSALDALIGRYRMVGTEVIVEGAHTVPIGFTVRVQAGREYFRSELLAAVDETLSAGAGGLFRSGRRGFGEGVYASDIIEAVVAVEGVETAEVVDLRRLGGPDRTGAGYVPVAPDEIALALNNGDPAKGSYRIVIVGGALG